MTDEEIERQFGPDDLGVIQRLLPGKPELHEKGRELFLRYYHELHPELAPTPFPGAADCCTPCAAAASVWPCHRQTLESAEISLQFFHLAEFFPILETGSPEGGVKPDRIRRALDRLDSSAGEAIYIGDSPTDVDACRAVPIRILAAGWAAEADVKGLEERKPDYLLTRFEDLDRFFREHDGNEGL